MNSRGPPPSSTSPINTNQPRNMNGNDNYGPGGISRSPGGLQLSLGSNGGHHDGQNTLESPVVSDSGLGIGYTLQQEEELMEHHRMLKSILSSFLGNDSRPKSTQAAREKLMRLSPTQFRELSTDVFDESKRRQDDSKRLANTPSYLLPSRSFHPKRNQARSKLATLNPDRFRQLSADVFNELERRVPRLTGNLIDRVSSPMSTNSSTVRSPLRANPPMIPSQPPPGWRSPGLGSTVGSPADALHFPERTTSIDINNSRPAPKQFQNNTIVPNKSTMVDGDDTDEEEREEEDISPRHTRMQNDTIQKVNIGADVHQELQKKIDLMTLQMGEKDNRIKELEEKHNHVDSRREEMESRHEEMKSRHEEMELKHEDMISKYEEIKATLDKERLQWDEERDGLTDNKEELNQHRQELLQMSSNYKEDLKTKDRDIRKIQDDHLQMETDTKKRHAKEISELTSRIDSLNNEMTLLRLQGGNQSDEGLELKCQQLENEVVRQRKVTEDVKEKATNFLKEMRLLSEHSDAAADREERLKADLSSMQEDLQEWKTRYAKARTELRTLKASSIGLPLQNMNTDVLSARQHFLSPQGVVHDVDITHFQMSIDELLRSARQNNSDHTVDKMKVVIENIQHIITGNEGEELTSLSSPTDSPALSSPRNDGIPPSIPTLRARVARNATGLITATRNYLSSDGMSPVSIIDAAAANLTAAVIDYVKTVGIKPSPLHELDHDGHVIGEEEDHHTVISEHDQHYNNNNMINTNIDHHYNINNNNNNIDHHYDSDGISPAFPDGEIHNEHDQYRHDQQNGQDHTYYQQQHDQYDEHDIFDDDDDHDDLNRRQQHQQHEEQYQQHVEQQQQQQQHEQQQQDEEQFHQLQPLKYTTKQSPIQPPVDQQQQQQQQQQTFINGHTEDNNNNNNHTKPPNGIPKETNKTTVGGSSGGAWHSRLKGSFDSTYSADDHDHISGDEFN